jgi:aconitase A
VEIPYHPARVLMQDFTGVPAVVDLAAMRDAVKTLGEDPALVNPLVPTELVVDHSIQVDYFGTEDSLEKNVALGIQPQRRTLRTAQVGPEKFFQFQGRTSQFGYLPPGKPGKPWPRGHHSG